MSRSPPAPASWGGLMPLEKAKRIIGSYLSKTQKMPGYSYNLSAKKCVLGSKLRLINNSVCAKCYAFRGRYQYPVVQKAMARHLKAIQHPEWVPAMATMINWWCRNVPYFRWHDSGDLQSVQHLKRINDIARLTPIVCHWIPTREVQILRAYRRYYVVAPNVCVRVSEPMIREGTLEGTHFRAQLITSGVAPRRSKEAWRKLVQTNTNDVFHCPASLQDGECKTCRACWQEGIKHVVYPQK